MNALVERYQHAVSQGEIEFDAAQLAVLEHLQTILTDIHQNRAWSWWPWQQKPRTRGLYIVGPVGTGKTFLVDLFFQHLPKGYGKRFHFLHFMQLVDQQLRQRQGQMDPLRKVIKSFAKETRLLCFDEFAVDDVAHAMILAELLDEFFANGLIFVATSNTTPDNLYLKGVQRQRFIPAIEAIKKHCDIKTLIAQRDYRTGRTIHIETYMHPLSQAHQELLVKQFDLLAVNPQAKQCLIVQNREIHCVKQADNIIWFEFEQICQVPRSQLDFLELSRRFSTFVISKVRQMGPNDTRQAILWIQLIDVLYDQNRRIIVSAEVDIDSLYTGGEMARDFKRTISRLHEMQSTDYQHKMGYISSTQLIQPEE
ncbi:cell division protein ZapE [Legionella sp. W05-934-2]|jgi:cell division protein ZapE|uniref:cell division protein ZapE n=1 Tax=Legionella sp. W05-934-2 TaxID=1198649 RepID=UPI00346332A5